MDQEGWPAQKVLDALAASRSKDHDFARGEILGSMCTEPHDMGKEAFARFLATNLGDPDHFPGTATLEREVLDDIAWMTAAPSGAHVRFLTGGTEANILACYMARQRTGRRDIVLSEAGHFSFEKAARLLGMRVRTVPAGPDLRSDPHAIAKQVGDDTAVVIAIAGSTELGLVDDVGALAAVAKQAGAECHVDAAFGGYVLPFLPDGPAWNLAVPGVTSVGLDPHKMGQAPVPAGALAVRDKRSWDDIAVETSYVSTDRQSTLMGTRPGAAVAATWAVHRRLGRAGYWAAAATCIENARHVAAGLIAAGAALVAEPELNVVTFRHGQAKATHAALSAAGFRCNIVPRFDALRIVVGPHVTRAVITKFLTAFEAL